MFTGLVEATARVVSLARNAGGALLRVEAPEAYRDAAAGESVAVSGVCLTVLPDGQRHDVLAFDVSPETLERTTLGGLSPGARVNLERALPASGRFGGHVVAGHVDATTRVVSIVNAGPFVTFTFAVGRSWERYVVEKGSIALDGVSLTVAALRPSEGPASELDVAVIPHTLRATSLADRAAGDLVNVEVDVIGKYVEKLLGGYAPARADERLAELLTRRDAG